MTPRAERTREALIDATVAALREDGSFTTEQVAGLAGVSVATVYNRIPEGRDGLLAGALDRLPESRLLRDAYRHREAEARESNRRFVELGQAAGRIGAGDTDEMADALVVLGQGLNNPVLLGHDDRPALAARLSAAMVALLSPTN